jgi:hypothetical protein
MTWIVFDAVWEPIVCAGHKQFHHILVPLNFYCRSSVNYSASKMFMSVPIYGRISTVNLSPGLRVIFGFLLTPMLAGVSVIITVPAGRVVP